MSRDTSKFVRYEYGEQVRVHCALFLHEKLRRIRYYDLISCKNDTEQIIRFSLIMFMILSFPFKQLSIQL